MQTIVAIVVPLLLAAGFAAGCGLTIWGVVDDRRVSWGPREWRR